MSTFLINKDKILILQIRHIIKSLVPNTIIALLSLCHERSICSPLFDIHHRPINNNCRFSDSDSLLGMALVEEHEIESCECDEDYEYDEENETGG